MKKEKFIETAKNKAFFSEEFNYVFDKRDGRTVMWGKTYEDDPDVAPFNVILDFEITERCSGIGDYGPCKFCSPAGTMIKTVNGEKPIETIEVGENVITFSNNESRGRFIENEVAEIYQREYKGELICIEFSNGRILKLTPNHKVMTKTRGWVEAGNLTEDDEVISDEDGLYKCKCCNKFISYRTSYKRYFCSEDCYNKQHPKKICPICEEEFVASKPTNIFCKACLQQMYPPGIQAKTHKLWSLYNSMIQRCYNKNRNTYSYYGGVGIGVDKRWQSFKNFLEDMESSYFDGATLDRIDNNKGYSKDNCRWVEICEQRVNRRRFNNSKRPYKNITLLKDGRYQVDIRYKGKCYYFGRFNSLNDALDVRNDFYKQNYPETYKLYIGE